MDDDTKRLEWLALNGVGVRRAGDGRQNLLVWGAAWPVPLDHQPSMLDQIRAAIDFAMERENARR